MAVLPGSLDYLYYNGILDHIPYEAYEQLPVVQNGTEYMSAAMSGQAYADYNNSRDSFELQNGSYSAGLQREISDIKNGRGEKNKTAKEKNFTKDSVLKGLAGIGVIALTIAMIIKGRKRP